MGENDCSICGKAFRSHRALKFHMDNHNDEKNMENWQKERERSRSRIRDLSASSGKKSPDQFKKTGEREGRREIKDFNQMNRLSKLDSQKMVCSEAGCTREFSTKIMLDFHMEKEHDKKQKGALEISRKGRVQATLLCKNCIGLNLITVLITV